MAYTEDDGYGLFYSEGGTIWDWERLSDEQREEYRKRAKELNG